MDQLLFFLYKDFPEVYSRFFIEIYGCPVNTVLRRQMKSISISTAGATAVPDRTEQEMNSGDVFFDNFQLVQYLEESSIAKITPSNSAV